MLRLLSPALPPSVHEGSAVDVQCLAGDKGGIRSKQKGDGPRHVVAGLNAPERRVVDETLAHLLRRYAAQPPREMPDDLLEHHLEDHLVDLEDPARAIFNVHAPPYGSGLDQAPVLDARPKPVVSGGAVTVTAVGSKAVRAVIERHQPALGLHGHIHESRGIAKIGHTICINTGSAYADGVLHGAIITLDRKKGVRQHLMASG